MRSTVRVTRLKAHWTPWRVKNCPGAKKTLSYAWKTILSNSWAKLGKTSTYNKNVNKERKSADMKIETMRKLDDVAKACVAGLETEIACGLTTPENVREVQSRTKNPTRLEVIKAMIRADLKKASVMTGAACMPFFTTVSNAMKSTEQSNYLANAIDARIKRRAWTNKSFDAAYRKLFGVRPHARSTKNS